MRPVLASLLCALFLLMQGLSLAHAAEFGAAHEHDGVQCEAVLLAEDADAVEPPVPGEPERAPAPTIAWTPAPYVAPALRHASARAPPPRAPPAPTR